MKIAVTSPFGWPYVRRGNRVAYELAVYLASQGNDVHFITTKPGAVRRDKIKGNLLIKYYPVIDNPFLTAYHIEYWQTFVLTCMHALLKEDYDIIHTCLTLDSFAASVVRSLKGTPFVPVLIQGECLYRDAPWGRRLFKRVVNKASRLVTISNFINDILKKDFGVDGVMIPCPVDTSKFYYTEKEKGDTPKILCTATLIMERKRVPLLIKAFESLIEQIPDAILQLAGETTPEITGNLLMSVHSRARRSIELLDITSDEDLASCYRDATISVLPSLKEPFGMVTTESLASGTPVVGTRSGGTLEILDDPDVGVLIEPTDGPDELCKALIKGIELAYDPQTSEKCSRHAERYSWNTLGPKYEELQLEILNHTKKRNRAAKRIGIEKVFSARAKNKSIISNGHIKKSRLNKFYIDSLDELEITSSTYYEIESRKPRYLHLLDWIFNKVKYHDSALIVSREPHFLTLLLRESGIEARQVLPRTGSEDAMEPGVLNLFSYAQELEQIAGNFDVIVCDDFLQYWASPLRDLQALRKLLSPGGVLLLSTLNAARGASRLRLLMGRNIYPWFDDLLVNTACIKKKASSRSYREYTLEEVNELVSKAGFELIEKRYIIGNIKIDKSVNFVSIPVKTYLLHKIDHQIQRLASPLRSHLFVAVKKSLSKTE